MFEKRHIVEVRTQTISHEGELIMDFNTIKENNQKQVGFKLTSNCG